MSKHVHDYVEGPDHRGANGLGDAEGIVHVGDPQTELVADIQQGVGDFIAGPVEGRGDLIRIVHNGALQVRQGDFAVGDHLLQLVGGCPQPLIQEGDELRGLLQQLADGLTVHHTLCKALVDGLHQAGDLLVGFAGRAEQHGGRVVEGDGLIDGAEQL